jgi:hypothetical protein
LDCRVVASLKDLHDVVIGPWRYRRSRIEPDDAAVGHREILWPISRAARDPLCLPGSHARSRLGGQGRNPPVGRVDDERRAVVGKLVAPIPPELVIRGLEPAQTAPVALDDAASIIREAFQVCRRFLSVHYGNVRARAVISNRPFKVQCAGGRDLKDSVLWLFQTSMW